MKKRLILFIVGLFVSMSAFALSGDSIKAVTMASYEQEWLDRNGTIALKNNTKEVVHNVSYRLIYKDMKGNILDYKDFVSNIEIEPGLVRKVDVEAYERERNYQYYKSVGRYDIGNTKFKVEFQLIGYNMTEGKKNAEAKTYSSRAYNDMDQEAAGGDLWPLITVVIMFSFVLGIFVLVGVLARKRNRSAALWVFISFFISPIIAILILLIIGRDND